MFQNGEHRASPSPFRFQRRRGRGVGDPEPTRSRNTNGMEMINALVVGIIYQRIDPPGSSPRCYKIDLLLSFRPAHLPWIPSSSCIFPKYNSTAHHLKAHEEERISGRTPRMEPAEVAELSLTALSGCCKFCGEPEEENKRFLICGHSLCTYKYYHIRCLNPKQIASEAQRNKPRWYCPSCLCRVCLSNKDDDQVILCDGCDEGHHLYCLNPPRASVPKGKWYCPSCNAKSAKEEELRVYERRMLKLHRKDDAILSSERYDGVDLLLNAADRMSRD
ncbi:hypothetical protein EJB05_18212 [Eragrostis curvula]|uniref:PHD-type domain-containing protein n=1 Tax=Eragrostis curvula TaxID=38414 RepID=A0A5J9VLE3_9POAL|nr:hypothetical protein EJB05_18212 [Eragrostis curvula]